jgi:hypothetical protein
VLLVAVGALAYVKLGPKPKEPLLVIVGSAVEEHDGRVEVVAGSVDRVGSAGQVLEQTPISGGRLHLDAAQIKALMAKQALPVMLRVTRAGTGGTFRTLVTILDAPDEIDTNLMVTSQATPSVFTLPPAQAINFQSGERGGFELVPAGAGPVFLDGICQPPELVPPGEWFLLYRAGAPATKSSGISDSSSTACLDVCTGTDEEACINCKIEQANVRTAARASDAQANVRRSERSQQLTQAFSIRADAIRFRLSQVDERCYGLIPRHDAELMGAFIVPVEPRHLVLETPEGERPIR